MIEIIGEILIIIGVGLFIMLVYSYLLRVMKCAIECKYYDEAVIMLVIILIYSGVMMKIVERIFL